jgi:hypothetical protein
MGAVAVIGVIHGNLKYDTQMRAQMLQLLTLLFCVVRVYTFPIGLNLSPVGGI